MNKNVEVLKLAKSYIDKPEKWTKNTDARDRDGIPVFPDDPEAVCFCTFGALKRAAQFKKVALNPVSAIIRPIISLRTGISGSSITSSNDQDETTHKMVMESFDEAIKRAE